MGPGPPAEQPVQRRRLQAEQQLAHGRRDVEPARLVVDRLLQPRGGLAGRRRERDERRRRPGGGRLLGEQRHDPRDRGRLAGARPAGDDREALAHRRGGRERLAAVLLAGEHAPEPGREQRAVDAARRGLGQRAEVRGEPPLLAPVAVEVEPRAEQPQRPVRRPVDARARPAPTRPPRRASRPDRATGARTGRPAPRSRPSPCRAPSRGRRRRGRAAARAPRARRRARPPGPRPRRAGAATWTSAGASTPASLNARSSPGAARARRTSKRSSAITRRPPARR